MSGAAKAVEDITGQHKQQRKARGERDEGYAGALDVTQDTFDLGKEFTKMGGEALANLMNLIENPTSITDMPGYTFRKEEGQRGVERGAAAKGKLFSGATMRELSRYNQEYASKERDIEIKRLSTLAELGLASGAKTSTTRANIMIARGEARAGARERAVAQQQEHGSRISQGITSGFGGAKMGGGGQPADKDQWSGQERADDDSLLGPDMSDEIGSGFESEDTSVFGIEQ